MNINEDGRRPHGWHGLDGDRCIERDTPTVTETVNSGGSKGGTPGTRVHPGVQILSFSCSFRQKKLKKIG